MHNVDHTNHFSQALLTQPHHNKQIYANGEGGIWPTSAKEGSTTNYAFSLQYIPVSRKQLVIFIIQGIQTKYHTEHSLM